jgi:Ca2+/Na+ antiporter
MTLLFLLLQFLICAGLFACAGYVLSRSADRIAQATVLSGGWIGLALLGAGTSLSALASGITSVTPVYAPNLAMGDALGACVFNLLLLVVIDAVRRKQPIYRDASAAHLLSAAFGVVMLGFVAMSLLALRCVYAHERSSDTATAGDAAAPAAAVMSGLVLRSQGRVVQVFSWVSVGMLAIHVLNATLVFLVGT